MEVRWILPYEIKQTDFIGWLYKAIVIVFFLSIISGCSKSDTKAPPVKGGTGSCITPSSAPVYLSGNAGASIEFTGEKDFSEDPSVDIDTYELILPAEGGTSRSVRIRFDVENAFAYVANSNCAAEERHTLEEPRLLAGERHFLVVESYSADTPEIVNSDYFVSIETKELISDGGCSEVSSQIEYTYLDGNLNPIHPSNHLLNLEPLDDACSPEAGSLPEYNDTYYGKIDPNGFSTTLDSWKNNNGFYSGGNEIINARYINKADLNFGRDMYCIEYSADANQPDWKRACYLDNYARSNPIDGAAVDHPFASVAMERVEINGEYETAFYVFDDDGYRLNSVNLDGAGNKSVPGACLSCHYDGAFLPFDESLYDDFVTGAIGSIDSNTSESIRKLNVYIHGYYSHEENRGTITSGHGRGNSKVDLRPLIESWYQGDPRSDTSTFFGENAPQDASGSCTSLGGEEFFECVSFELGGTFHTPQTAGRITLGDKFELVFRGYNAAFHQDKYDFYARNCRTCHAAQGITYEIGSQGSMHVSSPAGASALCSVCHNSLEELFIPEGTVENHINDLGFPIRTADDFRSNLYFSHNYGNPTAENLRSVVCEGGSGPVMPDSVITHQMMLRNDSDFIRSTLGCEPRKIN